jgi:hypothetical protein
MAGNGGSKVCVGVRVFVGVRVIVGVRVMVGIRVGVPVLVGVPVFVGVRVFVGVLVMDGVRVIVAVRVSVGVRVALAIAAVTADDTSGVGANNTTPITKLVPHIINQLVTRLIIHPVSISTYPAPRRDFTRLSDIAIGQLKKAGFFVIISPVLFNQHTATERCQSG